MKLSNLFLTVLSLASITSAQALEFQPGSIGFCPGVAPRVIAVGAVGATRSGGCCGTAETWTQPMMGRPWMPNHNLRAEIENRVRTVDFKKLDFGKSLANVVDPSAALMEQLSIRNSKVEACLSKVDLVYVNQTRSVGTDIKFAVGVKFSVASDVNGKRDSLLVQELAGELDVRSNFFDLYYDNDCRAQIFISNSWPTIAAGFDKFLAPVSNPEAAHNLEAIEAELGNYIGRN